MAVQFLRAPGYIRVNKKYGRDEAFCRKLDLLFSETSETTGREQSDITGMIGQYAHGNEPSITWPTFIRMQANPGRHRRL